MDKQKIISLYKEHQSRLEDIGFSRDNYLRIFKTRKNNYYVSALMKYEVVNGESYYNMHCYDANGEGQGSIQFGQRTQSMGQIFEVKTSARGERLAFFLISQAMDCLTGLDELGKIYLSASTFYFPAVNAKGQEAEGTEAEKLEYYKNLKNLYREFGFKESSEESYRGGIYSCEMMRRKEGYYPKLQKEWEDGMWVYCSPGRLLDAGSSVQPKKPAIFQ